MSIRNTLMVGLALAIASSSYSQFFARLWFKNVTTGYEGPGAVAVLPGHVVQIWYHFDDLGPNPPNQWGTFQATLILDGKAIITDADANTWRTQGTAKWAPAAHFPLRIFHQPDDGDMYDWAIDPTDDTKPWLATKGLYALIGVRGDRSSAYNYGPREVFQFTVGNAPVGQELHWAFDNRETGTGLSTRILDNLNISRDITDNWIRVVPEPGSIAAIATGLVGLLALRRRK